MYCRAPGRKILIKVLPDVQPLEETKEEGKKKNRTDFSPSYTVNGIEKSLCHRLHFEFGWNLRLPFLLGWEIMFQCTLVVLSSGSSITKRSLNYGCASLSRLSRHGKWKKKNKTKPWLFRQTIANPKTVFLRISLHVHASRAHRHLQTTLRSLLLRSSAIQLSRT